MVLKRTSCVPQAYAASPRDTRSSTAELSVSKRPTARAPDASRPRASPWWCAEGLHSRLSAPSGSDKAGYVTHGVVTGVPVARVQKTTIHTLTDKSVEGNEGQRPHIRWAKTIDLVHVSCLFLLRTGFASSPLRFVSYAPSKPGESFKESRKYKHFQRIVVFCSKTTGTPSTAGSRRGLTRPTSRRRRCCWTRWRNATPVDTPLLPYNAGRVFITP
jgi:hypothetical protein